jgi:hypothetical protein
MSEPNQYLNSKVLYNVNYQTLIYEPIIISHNSKSINWEQGI